MTDKNPFSGARWIWMNGRMVEFEKAQIHVLSHGLHYGSGAFEGIRCYSTPHGPAVFRLPEHMRRLAASCKIYRMDLPYTPEQLLDATLETVGVNGFDACYIRPIVFRGFGTLGVNPFGSPLDVVIAAWAWGKYLGEEAQTEGVDVCISTWRRPAAATNPTMAKGTGNYINSQLIKMEALTNGYVEGIALDPSGYVSEGSGENLFAVVDGKLVTTPLSASILPGITRNSIMTLAREQGLEVEERTIPRELLYICDELFFTGTAAEVTPIRSVDRIPVGEGRCGPITRRLMTEFHDIAEGRVADRHGWLSRVPARAAAV